MTAVKSALSLLGLAHRVVIPAPAGIPGLSQTTLDSRVRGNDDSICKAALLYAAALCLLSTSSEAQLRVQTGSSSSAISQRVRVSEMRETRNAVTVVPVIVLWRGDATWGQRGGPNRGGGSTQIGSGASGAATANRSVRAEAGGVSMQVDYQQLLGLVVINGRDSLRVKSDSTLIVMVDRVDSVGGPPVVSSLSVPLLLNTVVADTPVPPESVQVVMQRLVQTGRRENNLTRYLNTIPVVSAFIK